MTAKPKGRADKLNRSDTSYARAVYLNLKPNPECPHKWVPYGSKLAICRRCKGVQDDL